MFNCKSPWTIFSYFEALQNVPSYIDSHQGLLLFLCNIGGFGSVNRRHIAYFPNNPQCLIHNENSFNMQWRINQLVMHGLWIRLFCLLWFFSKRNANVWEWVPVYAASMLWTWDFSNTAEKGKKSHDRHVSFMTNCSKYPFNAGLMCICHLQGWCLPWRTLKGLFVITCWKSSEGSAALVVSWPRSSEFFFFLFLFFF